jgi:hypothetical protein
VFATATLIPFPSVTFQFPVVTPTDELNTVGYQSSQVPPKQGESSDLGSLSRLWPLALILAAWVILGVWFIIIQKQSG